MSGSYLEGGDRFRDMRLDFTFRFGDITVKATSRHAVHVPADAGAVRRGLLRHLASPPPGFGHVPHPFAAEHDAAPATPTSTCPYRGRAGRRRRSRSRPCACSWPEPWDGHHSTGRPAAAS
jgi:hypothetical protein